MKKFNLLLSAVTLLLAGSSFVDAQNAKNPWGITVGAHAVDYRSVRGTFDHYFDTKNWDIVPPLSKLSVIRNLNRSFNVDLTASVGEITDKRLNIKDELFINAGLGIRYQFANDYLLKSNSWFDPYVRVGASYLYYDYTSVDAPGYVATQGSSKHPYEHVLGKKATGEKNNLALQGGVGINFWITKNFGLNIASDYNWLPASGQDYFDFFQHTVGLTFRFGNNDWDGDGILNDVDACPEEAGIPTNDPATNGCPDTDGDGVVDKIDECPLVPGPAENNGCPWTEVHVAKHLTDILFEYNSDKIDPSSYNAVKMAADILNSQNLKDTNFYVDGYADQRGSQAYNLTLSKKRANAIVKILEERGGIAPGRLTARGFGKDNLLCTEDTQECYAKNRRVEVLPRQTTITETKVIKKAPAKKATKKK